jgi:hypothetical protein
MERGLLTPKAYDYLMNGDLAKSREIYQDVGNREYRIHMYDSWHRAASVEVQQISEEYLKANKISAIKPMTEGQAKLLVQEIIISPTPALTAYRDRLTGYQEGLGSEAAAVCARFLGRAKNVQAE